jgi:hypothetical protein
MAIGREQFAEGGNTFVIHMLSRLSITGMSHSLVACGVDHQDANLDEDLEDQWRISGA